MRMLPMSTTANTWFAEVLIGGADTLVCYGHNIDNS